MKSDGEEKKKQNCVGELIFVESAKRGAKRREEARDDCASWEGS